MPHPFFIFIFFGLLLQVREPLERFFSSVTGVLLLNPERKTTLL